MRSACIAWKKRQSLITTNAERESERSLGRTLTGKARINAYRDRIAETEQLKERKRARFERGEGNALGVPENRDDEQVAVRPTCGRIWR